MGPQLDTLLYFVGFFPICLLLNAPKVFLKQNSSSRLLTRLGKAMDEHFYDKCAS